METIVLIGLFVMIGMAFLRSFKPAARPPQVIYVLAEPPKKAEQSQESGFLPLLVLVAVIVAALWLF